MNLLIAGFLLGAWIMGMGVFLGALLFRGRA